MSPLTQGLNYRSACDTCYEWQRHELQLARVRVWETLSMWNVKRAGLDCSELFYELRESTKHTHTHTHTHTHPRVITLRSDHNKVKHAKKHITSPARLAQLLQPSLAFCFSLQPMTASPGRYAVIGCQFFYRAMHFSANARSWDRMSSVCLSVCPSVTLVDCDHIG